MKTTTQSISPSHGDQDDAQSYGDGDIHAQAK